MVGVDANSAEIKAKARLKVSASWRCEELPGGAEHGRRFAASGCGVGPQVLRPRLPVVSFRFAADLRCRPSEGEFGIWHAHHLVSDAVRLMLKWIVNLSDNELPL